MAKIVKNLNINELYLFEQNPRYTLTMDSKEKLRNISYDDLKSDSNINIAKKLILYEGDLLDLHDLLKSISTKKFREIGNPFTFLKIKKENSSKYIVTDGNRRLFALQLLMKKYSIEDLLSAELKEKNSKIIEEIKEIIINSETQYFLNLELNHSAWFDVSEIEEMFDDINMNHTGNGNGKRIWPRGKVLYEIFILYNLINNHKDSIENISNILGITNKKANTDLYSSIFVVELINRFNEINNKSQIDFFNIAPSSLELIKSTKLPLEVINHKSNFENKENIGDLFNIKIEKNKKTNKIFFNKDILKIINFDSLSNLLISGYKNEGNYSEIEEEFEKNKEKDNNQNSGLKKNYFFTTRNWTEEGTKKLYSVLSWKNSNTIEEKINEINKNSEKIFDLSIEEAKEISLDKNLPLINKNTKIILEEQIKFSEEIHKKKIIKNTLINNHLFNVLINIYNNEFLKLNKTLEQQISSMNEKDFVSQLAVQRSLYEIMSRLLLYIIIMMISEYTNLKLKEFISNLKIFKKKEDEFIFYDLLDSLFLENDSSNMELIFEKIWKKWGLKFIPDLNIFYSSAYDEAKEKILEKNEKLAYEELKKYVEKFETLTKKEMGKKLSLPLHYIEKFVTPYNYNIKMKLVNDFQFMNKEFSIILDYIIENIDILIYDDQKLRDFLQKK